MHGDGDQAANGGFETGDTTGWDGEWPWDQLVYSADPGDDDSTPDDDSEWYVTPHTGNYAAWFGQTFQEGTAWLGQTFDVPDNLTAGTVGFWYYMSKFGSCQFTFNATLVDANDTDLVLANLGAWTEADAAFIAHYQELSYPLSGTEIADLAGRDTMLRFDWAGSGAFISACYIYLDDVTFNMTW